MKTMNGKMKCFTQVALTVMSVCLMTSVTQAQSAGRPNMAAGEGSDVGKGTDGFRRRMDLTRAGYRGLTYGSRSPGRDHDHDRDYDRRDDDRRDRRDDNDRRDRRDHDHHDKNCTDCSSASSTTVNVTVSTEDKTSRGPLFQRPGHTCNNECRHRYTPRLHARCSSAISILKDYKAFALAEMGNTAVARQTILEGLENALKEFEHSDEGMPLTELALYRGLELNTAFQGACTNPADASCFDRENRAAVFFLAKYYSYIIDTVSKLDNEYFIPFITTYGHDRLLRREWPIDIDQAFLVKYKESAAALLDLYNGETQGSVQSYLTTNKYELEVASRILYWVSEDLDNDLMARDFVCVIQDAARASEHISRNIERIVPGRGFRTSTDVVNYARAKAWENAQTLKHLMRCN
jgi:hypothetical protein